MKGEKFSQEIASSTEDKASYSPAMENLEKIVYLGLAGSDFPPSQVIANLKYLKECSVEEFLAIVNKVVQKGINFKNLAEYSVVDYLDITQRVDRGDKDFQATETYFNLITYLEKIDDYDYSEEYQNFKRLGTQLFTDEKDFYQKVSYIYKEESNLEAKFLYQPPSISYLPLFVELYQILGGDFKLKAQEESARKKEFYNLILEKFKKLNALELGCGPGFGLKCLKKVAKNAIGLDKLKFSEQPKGLTIETGDILNLETNKNLAHKMFNCIFSSDLLECELFKQNQAKEIIKIAHNHLLPKGLQLHLVPYQQFSEKIVALKNYIFELKKQYPNEFDPKMEFDPNSDIMMSRTLLFEKNEITDLAKELNAKVIKNEISNHHWVLALQK